MSRSASPVNRFGSLLLSMARLAWVSFLASLEFTAVLTGISVKKKNILKKYLIKRGKLERDVQCI